MEQIVIDNHNQEINNKKCYSCGKVFRTPANLKLHKDRKTPCLIREVPEAQINNPNRCIFCNKVFTNRSHLTRHHDKCKIKNGGMGILDEKVRHEQEIRILKEQREIDRKKMEEKDEKKDEEMRQMREQLMELQKQMKQIVPNQQPIINNTVNNVINVQINNYLEPNLEHIINRLNPDESLFISMFKENLVQTPMAIVPIIWFNENYPSNLAIYLVNKANGNLLVFNNNRWESANFHADIARKIRDRAYTITETAASIPLFKLGRYEDQLMNIKKNHHDEELSKIECDQLFHVVLQNRELVEPYTLLK